MAADADILQKLREIDARQQIHDCIMRYSRGVDHSDLALAKSAYHPDAYQDHGMFKGPAAEILEKLNGMSAGFETLSHLVCNEYVEFDPENDATAYSETSFLVFMVTKDEGRYYLRTSSSRWLDRFELRESAWKIVDRRLVFDWEGANEEIPGFGGDLASSGMMRGYASQQDPSFTLLRFARWSDGAA